jgi:hypothetical protein
VALSGSGQKPEHAATALNGQRLWGLSGDPQQAPPKLSHLCLDSNNKLPLSQDRPGQPMVTWTPSADGVEATSAAAGSTKVGRHQDGIYSLGREGIARLATWYIILQIRRPAGPSMRDPQRVVAK